MNHVERFRQKIDQGGVCLGTGISMADPIVSEIAGQIGFDFLWIDMEHPAMDAHAALCHVIAARAAGTCPIIRVRCNDPDVIKPVIDMAPGGVLVPRVNSAAETQAVVTACRYPPQGTRGYGSHRGLEYGGMSQSEYLEIAPDLTMVMVQIEHIDAVNDIDAILQVPGLDAVCVGPNDLSGSLNKLGQHTDPQVDEAICTVLRKASDSKVYAGISGGYDRAMFERWAKLGAQWINIGGDWAHLAKSAREELNDARAVLDELT